MLTLTKHQQRIAWRPPTPLPAGVTPHEVYVGQGEQQFAAQVAIVHLSRPLGRDEWQQVRKARNMMHVVIVGQLADHLYLFGPGLDQAPIGPVSAASVQRILDDALGNDDFVIMAQQLHQNLEALRSNRREFVGINNNGLFANHELYHGVPQRPDWQNACTTAQPWLPARGINLIEALGYTTSTQGANALLMSNHAGQSQAVAILLQNDEDFDGTSVRIGVSPVAHGLAVAQRMQVPWVMLLRDATIRLYPANPDYGTGRRGLAETYCELNLSVLDQAQAGYLALIFAAEALSATGSIYSILANSNQYAVALGKRLREKVYSTIVPTLAVAVANECARIGMILDRAGLDRAYQITLRIFFRLLFQAYAEDRRLLPYGSNQQFDAHSLNQFAQLLLTNAVPDHDAHSTALWDSLHAVWRAIDAGNPEWDIPAYNGGLFGSHPQHHPDGNLISKISLPDHVLTPVLSALLLDSDDTQTLGAIDFRSLSVREFGTIYEGLLESNLGIAEYDLTLDANDTWVPARAGEPVQAPRGSVYFHNTSGQRKGTGSYFTPAFVVEHLIERALIPALDRHLADIKAMMVAGQTRSAGERFFDFRVADLAMGSGHFLTAAIDHIENRMAAFLAETPIDRVSQELAELTAAAQEALPHMRFEIERSALLRRQIARRCIYGLDINPIAVELARVSIWIHTFVRGLPMSSLDHNLVCANALTGIGTIDEALDVLLPKRRAGQVDMMETAIRAALDQARMTMVGVNASTEATIDQTRQVSADIRRAQTQARQAKLLFDAAVLMRIGQRQLVNGADPDDIAEQAGQATAQAALAHLAPAHMPVLFPEVFLRENGGFDVLLGNPPWEEVMLDEAKFWLRYRPGLLSIPSKKRLELIEEYKQERPDLVAEFEAEVAANAEVRRVLLAGPFPDIGKGDIDLYRVFAWRNWQLIRHQGHVSLVLPRSILNSAGNAYWRQNILVSGILRITTLVNTGKWIFPEVHPQYSFSLISICKASPDDNIYFQGPFHDHESFNASTKPHILSTNMILNGAEGAAFPSIPDEQSLEIYKIMRQSIRFDVVTNDWNYRLIAEMHATADRQTFDSADISQPHYVVYGGASFNLWEPATGEIFAYANPRTVTDALSQKRQRQIRLNSSGFYGMSDAWAQDENTLPFRHPRIAYRQITRPTDTRTVICTLVPPNTILTNAAPYIFSPINNKRQEAYVLGVLSSIPFDWYARRHVELNFNFHILYSAPIPRPHPDDPRRRRVIEIAGRLAAVDARYQAWADAVGVPVGSVTSAALKDDLIAELDALVAHLYGLNRAQLCHVFATFHRGWAYQSRLDRVLYFYDQLRGAHA
jgi:hypothetical protein